MPFKPKKPCAVPGCPTLAYTGQAYCEKHWLEKKKVFDQKAKETNAEFYKLYHSQEWRTYRDCFLKANPFCVCGNPATVVDHIKPVRRGGDFWDSNNHQPKCASCHSRKTAKEDGGYGRKTNGEGV